MPVLIFLLPQASQAQWSGSVAADSDYLFRGESLGGGHPTLRLSANYDGGGGWYAGASATQAQLPQRERYAQVLAYAGRAMPLGGTSASLDVGATASTFIGDHQYDFAEVYGGLTLPSGSVRVAYSPDYFGRHVSTVYLEGNEQWPLRGRARLLAHAGLLLPVSVRVDAAPGSNRARADLRLGAGWTLGSVELTLAWSAVTIGGPPPLSPPARRRTWIAGATWLF